MTGMEILDRMSDATKCGIVICGWSSHAAVGQKLHGDFFSSHQHHSIDASEPDDVSLSGVSDIPMKFNIEGDYLRCAASGAKVSEAMVTRGTKYCRSKPALVASKP